MHFIYFTSLLIGLQRGLFKKRLSWTQKVNIWNQKTFFFLTKRSFYFLFLAVLDLWCYVGFSVVTLCSFSMWLSLCGAWALGTWDSVVTTHRLSSCGSQLWCMVLIAPWHVGSSQLRDGTCISCTGKQIRCHWAPMEDLIFLFNRCMCVLVAQSCPTLSNHMNRSPPDLLVHGILQARILEWVAISFSGGSPALQADVCICITKSLCSTPETSTESQLYTNVKN